MRLIDLVAIGVGVLTVYDVVGCPYRRHTLIGIGIFNDILHILALIRAQCSSKRLRTTFICRLLGLDGAPLVVKRHLQVPQLGHTLGLMERAAHLTIRGK